jgi:DNA-binding transcriptional LysR family regulator
MNMAHLRSIDLNLLVILDCLFRHSNVSSAAKELGLTQSAISHSLSKLRDHYKDSLFVRVSKGVEPTTFAKSIRKDIEDFVVHAVNLTEKVDQFDPATSSGRIVIATTDYFEITIAPHLLTRLSKEAPKIQISLRPTFGSLPKEQLEDGTYDLAIAGFYKKLPEGFYQQRLYTDTFSTAYRKGHPLIKNGLNSNLFFDLEHAFITLQGDFKDALSQTINGKKKIRNIKYGSSSFTGPAWLVAESNLLLTAPSSLLNKYKKYFPIIIEECPVPTKTIDLQMVWHGLTNQSPLKKWFRQVLKEICQKVEAENSRL